jgi:hypothetical protein
MSANGLWALAAQPATIEELNARFHVENRRLAPLTR